MRRMTATEVAMREAEFLLMLRLDGDPYVMAIDKQTGQRARKHVDSRVVDKVDEVDAVDNRNS